MSAQILDGRLVSQFLLKEVAARVSELQKQEVTPQLVIIRVGENPASLVYIRQKLKAAKQIGIEAQERAVPVTTTTEDLIAIIEELNKDNQVSGMIVQMPLPEHIQTPLVIRAIDPHKDVDGFHAYNIGKLFLSKEFEYLAPCTPRGIITLLDHFKISLAGQHVVIIGRSNVVGKPLAVMCINRDATVTVCHSKTANLEELTKQADILVAAVGRSCLVTATMVKPGAVVVDVGITKVNNTLVGDVAFEEVSKKAAWITPVPGGVGPMTVACLMENVVRAAERQIS